MPQRARPTLRCLREDLGQAIPRADTPLDEVPHPLLAKASERFADDSTPQRVLEALRADYGTTVPTSLQLPDAIVDGASVSEKEALFRCNAANAGQLFRCGEIIYNK